MSDRPPTPARGRADGYRHLVLVSIDTLRSDCIASSPLQLWPHDHQVQRILRTGVLDELVGQGAFFPYCITAAPYTSAAHAAVLTGQQPLRNGLFELFNRPLRSPTVMTLAKAAGYRTLMKVDFPIPLGPFLGFDRDVDHFIVEDDSRYLDSLDRDVPSVSLVHFGGVHVPYGFHDLRTGGQAYRDKVDELEAGLDELAPLPIDQLVETYRDAEDMQLLLRYKRAVEYHFTLGHHDLLFDLYLEGVEHFVATRFATFFERLRERLPDDDWLLVLFGDHGEEYSNDTYGHYNSVEEGVLRVPLLFVGPGVEPDVHLGRVRTIDILPTVLDRFPLLAAEAGPLDGRSLATSVWEGTPHTELRPAISQAWIATQTEEYVARQKELVATGASGGPVPHLLYKEAAYQDEHKLVRDHARFSGQEGFSHLEPAEPTAELFDVKANGLLTPAHDPAAAAALTASLVEYNRLAPPDDEAARPIPEAMRAHLRQSGYRL